MLARIQNTSRHFLKSNTSFSLKKLSKSNFFARSYHWTNPTFSGVGSFKNVSFEHSYNQQILDDVNFSIEGGSKITIMGQNGAGKSTIIKLLSGDLTADEGRVNINPGETVATAMQTMPLSARSNTVIEFFRSQFNTHTDPGSLLTTQIHKVLNEVHLDVNDIENRTISSFSGGQQARLLLAAALIKKPSILLLDEPTNNLDVAGINHLQAILMQTSQTVLVISHDEDFLNSFTDSVLYLDIFSKKVESYYGDYFYVKSEIAKRIKRENQQNARLAKEAQKKKEQAGVFANKGGGMRKVAKRMRTLAAKLEDDVVDVRKEDVALSNFQFPFSRASSSTLMDISSITTRCPKKGKLVVSALKNGSLKLQKGSRIHIHGPNGIGKTTFLERMVKGEAEGVEIGDGVRIGYYRQDFHNFDFEAKVMECLEESSSNHTKQEIRKIAAKFLLKGSTTQQQVKTLSEGQKALLSLACLNLQAPSVLVMDEPTNHVNFRHLPAVAQAVKDFQGAVICVSHDHDFVRDVDCKMELDLGYELNA